MLAPACSSAILCRAKEKGEANASPHGKVGFGAKLRNQSRSMNATLKGLAKVLLNKVSGLYQFQ